MRKYFAVSVLCMAKAGVCNAVAAQTANPYGLVYEGAITENRPHQVNIHPVTYQLNGIKISANIYTPADYQEKGQYAAIVVAHPNGGVKEQVAGLFAQKLSELGYITIAADAAFQGASGGEPRHQDIPYFRTEDIRGMIDEISSYKGVDPKKIGAVGICGGGGYTLNAVKSDKRVKAVVTLSMFNTGDVRRNGYMNSDPAGAQKRLDAATEARASFTKQGKHPLLGGFDKPLTDEEIAKIPTDLYREGYEYYMKTHAHPNSGFTVTADSMQELIAFDVRDQAELINVPLLMMAGDKADSLYMTQDFFDKATGTKDKELYLIAGATHIKTYYVREYVEQEVAKLKEFFGKHLK